MAAQHCGKLEHQWLQQQIRLEKPHDVLQIRSSVVYIQGGISHLCCCKMACDCTAF